VGDGDIPSGVSKLTVPEAARALGISPEAVRNRLSRGTLKSIKEEGTVYVHLEADRSQHLSDIPTDRPRDISSELVDELRDRVRYLERVPEEEREARTEERRRHDTLMAQLMSRIPEIEAPPEAPEAPETATEQPGRKDTGTAGRPAGARRAPVVVEAGVRILMIIDWITAIVAVGALVLSIYNTYTQQRDRTPRVKMSVSWAVSSAAPTALQGLANPTTKPGEADYRCEITNIGKAGVKIRKVTILPLAPPGKPLPMQLPQGEQPRKLDNGDSQTWSLSFDMGVLKQPLKTPVRVFAEDTVGNIYEAKEPALFPYPHPA
jgi:hypothetical protein